MPLFEQPLSNFSVILLELRSGMFSIIWKGPVRAGFSITDLFKVLAYVKFFLILVASCIWFPLQVPPYLALSFPTHFSCHDRFASFGP